MPNPYGCFLYVTKTYAERAECKVTQMPQDFTPKGNLTTWVMLAMKFLQPLGGYVGINLRSAYA